ncbi:class I SAM-dependent methyltransferase [Luminiphilus sp.]|nr:class I SAM-dependent methyltransferase [Luminiphilus sp.]MDA8827629.1 class I SAM-dependent methyltransferase [Luminiphilus sp.]MDC3404994.1 class I SAM-dependent methyltransferase [Luminiphilus sp.]MDC6484996.1 class I SAM-dependent methyltransferase [Luminiphilus sp.]
MSNAYKEQQVHDALPATSHDELARQHFVRSFKEHLVTDLHPGLKTVYEKRAKGKFVAEHQREPETIQEVGQVMKQDSHYQAWSSLLRTSQEMMWSSAQIPVQRAIQELATQAAQSPAVGSLRLNPDLQIPAYHTAVDIHCQPGGYHTEYIENDVAQGAIYDRAVYIYAMGQMGVNNADMGDSTVAWLKQQHPEFKPTRILDMGCAVGHSTLPYVSGFEDAEVHAIDVAAPMLRYAHARASSMGLPVHFSQQNAETIDFEDNSFDLVVSHILLHETSSAAIKNIIRECHRVLKPGGMMLHVETPPYEGMEPFDTFLFDWDSENNNEPFWRKSHLLDLEALAKDSGFQNHKPLQIMVPSAFQETKRTNTFQGGDFGGGGVWFVYGCQK